MRITLTEATAAKTLPQLINEFINRKRADGLRDRTLREFLMLQRMMTEHFPSL